MSFKAALLQFVVMAAIFSGAGPLRAETVTLVALGDSLTAGYMLAPEDSYPAQLEQALKARGHDVKVINAGVSGDTTSGGLARLDWSVPDEADGVLLALGANDALRGISPAQSERNLDAMLARLYERGIPVLLLGMLAPPNMGSDYADAFNPLYERLASRRGAALHPFFLDGVVTVEGMQLDDAMHPNARGVAVMVENTLPSVVALLQTIAARTK